ncbi:MAG: MFS transporter [Chloroflexi bacterium]|nr:MFS transporter [Chloroflexota bacterium]
MGLDNSAMSLGRIAGPLWAGALYDSNIDFPYMSGSIVMLLGFALSVLGMKDVQTDQSSEQMMETAP